MTRPLFFVVSLLSTVPLATHGQIVLEDDFDYSDGTLTTVSGGKWSNHNGEAGQVDVAGGLVTLTQSETEDINAALTNAPFTAGNLYAAFTVNFSMLPSGSGAYFMHFKTDGSSTFRAKVFATTAGAGAGKLRVGIANVANSPDALIPADLNLNTDYRLVLRYNTSPPASTLWLDPAAESDSIDRADAAASTSSAGITKFALRQSLSSGNGMGTLSVGDLKVGTTFSSVTDTEDPPPPPPPPPPTVALTVLNYNVKGNGVEDWSTNSVQVRAIGRQLSHLDADVITLQEIPRTNILELANWVTAFLPGYHLATNSGTDGYVRSAILSRHPISAARKWLDGVPLDSFGYDGKFTRDLFEAEINVPGFDEPLHVFTTHLKSGGNADDFARRAAEASAISNFFISVFLPSKGGRPYLLTGDFNEDVNRPPGASQMPVQRMANAATGLHLTTPVNPFTGDDRTFSIQAGSLSSRLDYILTGGVLSSNIAVSQVFRTDRLSPLPAGLFAADSATASDHLPVLMSFSNPFNPAFHVTGISMSDSLLTLNWESTAGRLYRVESATLTGWSNFSSNITATGSITVFATNVVEAARVFRVLRLP